MTFYDQHFRYTACEVRLRVALARPVHYGRDETVRSAFLDAVKAATDVLECIASFFNTDRLLAYSQDTFSLHLADVSIFLTRQMSNMDEVLATTALGAMERILELCRLHCRDGEQDDPIAAPDALFYHQRFLESLLALARAQREDHAASSTPGPAAQAPVDPALLQPQLLDFATSAPSSDTLPDDTFLASLYDATREHMGVVRSVILACLRWRHAEDAWLD